MKFTFTASKLSYFCPFIYVIPTSEIKRLPKKSTPDNLFSFLIAFPVMVIPNLTHFSHYLKHILFSFPLADIIKHYITEVIKTIW